MQSIPMRILKGIMMLPILPFAIWALVQACLMLMVLTIFRQFFSERFATAFATTLLVPLRWTLSAIFFVHNLWLDEELQMDVSNVPGMNHFF